MIQRIQSVFLAGIAIALAIAPFFSIWSESANADGSHAILTQFNLSFTGTAEDRSMTTFYLFLLNLCGIGLAVFSLLSYTQRPRQMMINMVNTLVLIALLGTSSYIIYATGEPSINPNELGDLHLGFFLPAIALVLNSLANRFIHRDEKLVKSVDRLR